jgi:hypothetical protein
MDKNSLKELLKETRKGKIVWTTDTNDFWKKGRKEYPYTTIFKGSQLSLFSDDVFVYLQIDKGSMVGLKEESFLSFGKKRLIRDIFSYLIKKDYKRYRALNS